MDIPEHSHGLVTSAALAPMLSLDAITRGFGGTLALDGAALEVSRGTVHAVLGENGAGKTTLLRIAFGMLQPDAGTLRWNGRVVTIGSPSDAMRLGIGMVHQHFSLVPAMTVAENVALGGHGRYDRAAASARVREVGARAGLQLDPDKRVGTLSVGAQQRCEIVKALARDVKLLILDEPTAVLPPQEAAELLAWTRGYADAGHAVVLITHKLRDALAIADAVTVLRRGKTVLTSVPSRTSEADLANAMLGATATADNAAVNSGIDRDIGDATQGVQSRDAVTDRNSPIVISADGLRVRDERGIERVRGASLTVRAGEIVGIAAVEGSGHGWLLRALAGRVAADGGTVNLPATVGFIPEDRQHDALLLDAPLYENVALRGAGARRGRMGWARLRHETRVMMAEHDVRATGEGAVARALSGGNQQKLVLARELADEPAAIIAENPSRGLDFHATAAVQQWLREAAMRGAAVVVHSSDLDEVLALASRVYAMRDGVLYETPADRDAVGRAMLGGGIGDMHANDVQLKDVHANEPGVNHRRAPL